MMNASLNERCGLGGVCMLGPDTGKRKMPRVVLGGAELAGRFAEQFRQLGWDVHTTDIPDDAVTLALKKNPAAVVLPVESEDGESGYLLSAKLRKAKPKLRVVLVAEERTGKAERLAKFVGATLASETTAPDELAKLM